MNLRALYASKLAKCLLICSGDLVGDPTFVLNASERGLLIWRLFGGFLVMSGNINIPMRAMARDLNLMYIPTPYYV